MRTSIWHGWMLVFLSKQFFGQGTSCQDKNGVFKNKMVNTNKSMADKIMVINLREAFKDVHGVYYFDSIDEDDIHGVITIMDY